MAILYMCTITVQSFDMLNENLDLQIKQTRYHLQHAMIEYDYPKFQNKGEKFKLFYLSIFNMCTITVQRLKTVE